MGESKRRRLLDPNYGKPNFLTAPELSGNRRSYEETISDVLSGQTLLSCFCIQDASGSGDHVLVENDISEIVGCANPNISEANVKMAYEIATQENTVKLGIRRQQEQGKGFLSLMDAGYRKLIGLHIPEDGNGFIFNWYTIPEIKIFPKGSIMSSLVLALTSRCDDTHQFPCLFSGIPLDEQETTRANLLFMVSDRKIQDSRMNIKIGAENFI